MTVIIIQFYLLMPLKYMANAVPWSIKPDGQVKVLILLHKGDGF